MATLQAAINIARGVLQDTDASAYRYSDADLLQYGNDALDAICHLRPELFYAVAEVTCIANQIVQTFAVADSLGLVDILGIKDGNAVREIKRAELDLFRPGWASEAAAAAAHWMRMGDDPQRFLVYPKSPSSQVLIGQYVKAPGEYTAVATHPLPDAFTGAIAHYIVGMAESREDEAVVSQRAQMAFSLFTNLVAGSNANNVAEKKS